MIVHIFYAVNASTSKAVGGVQSRSTSSKGGWKFSLLSKQGNNYYDKPAQGPLGINHVAKKSHKRQYVGYYDLSNNA